MNSTGSRPITRSHAKRKAPPSPPTPPPLLLPAASSAIDLTSPPSSPTAPPPPRKLSKPSTYPSQTPRRRVTHARLQSTTPHSPPTSSSSSTPPRRPRFDYSLPYATLDLRVHPELYRIGVGEQGVLLVQPYKAELLPLWRFRTPADARVSAAALWERFEGYRDERDVVGMDMARKFLQMGRTRSRRYANHRSGRKYDAVTGEVLPLDVDEVKAESAEIFMEAWQRAESDPIYKAAKAEWKRKHG